MHNRTTTQQSTQVKGRSIFHTLYSILPTLCLLAVVYYQLSVVCTIISAVCSPAPICLFVCCPLPSVLCLFALYLGTGPWSYFNSQEEYIYTSPLALFPCLPLLPLLPANSHMYTHLAKYQKDHWAWDQKRRVLREKMGPQFHRPTLQTIALPWASKVGQRHTLNVDQVPMPFASINGWIWVLGRIKHA